MSATEIPVYRPEVTVYRRDPDGQWEPLHGGMVTNTLFRPMPDEDALTEAGFRRVVRLGTEPFFRIVLPEGAGLVEKGRATFLELPGGKALDAITATAYAKTRQMGLDLVRPGREPATPREPDLPARASDFAAAMIEVGRDLGILGPATPGPVNLPPPTPPPPTLPARPRGPVRQLSMFGEETTA